MKVKELIERLSKISDQDTDVIINIDTPNGFAQYDIEFDGEDCVDQLNATRAYCINVFHDEYPFTKD